MADEKLEKSIRILPFKGKDDEEYSMWSQKFLARASMKGYDGILEGSVKVKKDGESSYSDKELTARAKNKEAYNDLILSMDGKVCFKIVKTSVTADLPKGSAYEAWQGLTLKYLPNNKTS